MKYLLFDFSNDGIIAVLDSIVVANHLKSGLVDVGLKMIHYTNPMYSELSRHTFLTQDKHYCLKRDNNIIEMPKNAYNELYLNRKELVKVRITVMELLAHYIAQASITCHISLWNGIDNTLQFALRDCDPENEVWSDSVIEYASLNDIEPKHAYREIKLQLDDIHNLKMRSYSLMKRYVTKINNIQTKEEAKDMTDELKKVFVLDTWI